MNCNSTKTPPMYFDPFRWKLGRHNSTSSLSQERRVDDDHVKHKETHTRIIYLPKDVIFNILLFLPAKHLQEVVRYVCKEWYDIVSDLFFVRAHCQMPTTNTSASIIIQSQYKLENIYYGDKDSAESSVKVTKIEVPFPAMIQGSCNGLVLFCDKHDSRKVYLMNPLTKLIVSLPLVVPVVEQELYSRSYTLAVNSSGQYKMVHFLLDYCSSNRYTMSVFTIVDKAWRPIDLQHFLGLDLLFFMSRLDWSRGIFIAGFMYWWCTINSVSLAMDIDTEILYLISLPKSVDSVFYKRYFINMGTALGIMAEDCFKPGIWKLLKLTDVKSSEWTTIAMIDIVAIVTKVTNGEWTAYNSNSPSIRPGSNTRSQVKLEQPLAS
ncbi:putative F-box protein At3g52320 [Silene latifolia]|uniref:putative F-box protein At3g52320 n=1 Tax=Silene latifolia TaxID=37657 RepID=UPI003D76B89A